MNLCACLGVGPGHRLLLGPVTPTAAYAASTPAPSSAPVRIETRTLRPARATRCKRGTAETRALYERCRVYISDGLARGRDPFELRDEFAKAEDIERSYVDYIVSKLGLARKRRTASEIKAIVARALSLLEANPRWTKAKAAAELGVSEEYLHVAMSRHGE